MPISPWQSHQRLESTVDSASAPSNPNAQIIKSPNANADVPLERRPWWRRFFRSCMTSSNPDPDQATYRHPPIPKRSSVEAGEMRSAEEMEVYRKKQKRASYVPQHAASTFASSTTPLGGRDSDRAQRSTMIYQAGSHHIDEDGLEVAGSVTSPKSPPVGLSFDPQPAEAGRAPAASHF